MGNWGWSSSNQNTGENLGISKEQQLMNWGHMAEVFDLGTYRSYLAHMLGELVV